MKQLHQQEKINLERILSQNGRGRIQDLMAVLDTFLAAESHQTVEEVQRRLKARGLNFDRAYVQDALDLFCQYGFAQAKSFNGHETRYEHRHLGQHHDHLICTRCRKVEEFINPQIEVLQECAAREKGFVPLDHRMDIYGLCAECAGKRGEAIQLCEAEKGERLVICGHEGGEELQRRLTDMGLNNGAEIEVLSNGGGPIVVACRGCRLALGRGMTQKVMVSPVDQTDQTPSQEAD